MLGQIGKRVLSIWLPQLPLDRLIRKGDPRTTGIFAITAEINNTTRLTHLSISTKRAGLSLGLSVPDARAICPDLITESCDPVREAALLRTLWRWADTLSPSIALDPPDGLLLDITGCAHLFGSEKAMAAHAQTTLADMHITSRIGIADTKKAAWALARFGNTATAIAPSGDTINALRNLPIAALDLTPALINDLRRLGLATIGQLHTIKPSELMRRFGLDLTQALAGTLGQRPDPISPKSAIKTYAARMTVPDPIGLVADLEAVLQRLSNSVCDRLKQDHKGARRFHLTVRCVSSGDHTMTIGFAKPCFASRTILQQFSRPLEALKIDFGADWFRLAADQIEPVSPHQTTLENQAIADDDTAQVISTLGNRLGFDRVRQFAPGDSHLPEREYCAVEAIDRRNVLIWKPSPRKRPIRLFNCPERLRTITPGRPPETFEWRQRTYRTKRAIGPERLTPEWWRDENLQPRDYWRIQTIDGPRLWLMTYPGTKTPDWFVAGRFP